MPRTRTPYPTDFREQMVALARTGRSVESLAREYEPCAATIHEWVREGPAQSGVGPSDLSMHTLMQRGRLIIGAAGETKGPIKLGEICQFYLKQEIAVAISGKVQPSLAKPSAANGPARL